MPFTLLLFACNNQKKPQLQQVPEDYDFIVQTGQLLPEFTMTLTDGSVINSSEFKGKVVMLQFTASWCGVCRKEMPHIENDIWQKYKNRNDFALYGIDLDEPVETVLKFAGDMKISYPLALDPKGHIFYKFATDGAGITRNVIAGKDGKIIYMTRLFKEEEFNQMKMVIDLLLENEV